MVHKSWLLYVRRSLEEQLFFLLFTVCSAFIPFLFNDMRIKKSRSFDLNSGVVACYPFPNCFSAFDSCSSPRYNPFLDETRNCKRIKHAQSTDESVANDSSPNSTLTAFGSVSSYGSTESLYTLPKLHFRDHVWAYTQRYLAVEAMEQAASSLIQAEGVETKEEENQAGMRLVQLLIACAEAVACRDKAHASMLLSELRADALVFGTSFQRVASCFVQGLSDRLAQVQPLGAVGSGAPVLKTMAVSPEKEEALNHVYDICPHIQFGHFVANALILEAFEGESSVHIIDLGMTLGLSHGQQWRMLMNSLVNRGGSLPRRLQITGVGNCGDRLETIGNELLQYADGLELDLEFSVVESNLEDLKPEDFKIRHGQVLVINSILQLHCVVKESRGALNVVLQNLRSLSPKTYILVEQDSSHNGPFFLGRFMESLHYFSAIFDSLDAMLPRYDTRRAKIEQFYFGDEIKNIVSCEGLARVERHEKLHQWRRRISRAGFISAPIKCISQAKKWLEGLEVCEGYNIVVEKGCLTLGWESKPIVAVSCWKCSPV